MKNIIIAVFALISFVGMSQQNGKGKGKGKGHERKEMTSEQKADRLTAKMKKTLVLDSVQGQKISAINRSCAAKNETIRKTESLTKEQKKTQCEANRVSAKTEIKALLNDAQKTKFEEMEKQREARKAAKKAEIEKRKAERAKNGKGKKSSEQKTIEEEEEDDEDDL